MASTMAPTGRSHSLPLNSLSSAQASRRHSALQSFGFRRKSEIEIVLDGNDDFIHSYSTFDEIKGYVKLQFEKDTSIDDVHVYFLGQTDTWVERMAGASPRSGRALAKHIFLRMQQPIPGNIFPDNRVAQAGVIYAIPFTFVVPDRLLPFVCCHKVANTDVKNQHLQLPPSTGDETIAGEGSILMNDLAPTMSKIVYCIRVRIAKASITSRHADVLIESLRVRIIPTREEMPPVPVEDGPRECMKFRLRKEKDVRKGILRMGKRLGRLSAETLQPKPIQLSRPNRASREAPSTMMNVQLRYDPALPDEQPPQLSSVVTKLKTLTFFGATAFQNMPCANKYDVFSAYHGHYPTNMDLSTMNLSSVTWTKHDNNREVSSVAAGTVTERNEATVGTTKKPGFKSKIRRLSVGTSPGGDHPTPAYQEEENGDHASPARRESAFSDTSVLSATSSNEDSIHSSSTLSSSTTRPQSVTSASNAPSALTPIISPSTSYNSNLPYYTTSILVPISLPTTQRSTSTSDPTSSEGTTNTKSRSKSTTFLPTFHSCLVSRTYSLDLNVSTSGTNVPNLNLHVPVQMYLKPGRNPNHQHNTQQYQQINAGHPLVDGIGDSPPSFHNPFDPNSSENTNPNPSAIGGYLDDDIMFGRNDEAIARILGRSASYSNYPYTPASNYQGGLHPRSLPEEDEEEQPQATEKTPMYTETESQPQSPLLRSPSSAPLTPYSEVPPNITIPTQSTTIPQSPNLNQTDQQPPGYYSSFRHTSALASELATTSLGSASTSASTTSTQIPQPSSTNIRRSSTQMTTNSNNTITGNNNGTINTTDEPRPRTTRRDSGASRLRIRRWI